MKITKSDDRPFVNGIIVKDTWPTEHPLLIEGCLVMLCVDGEAKVSINSHEFIIKPGMVVFIAFDMVIIPVEISADFKARFLSMDFDTTQNIFFTINSNRFWDFIYKSPVLTVPDSFTNAIKHWYALLDWYDSHCQDMVKNTVLRNEAENFMLVMSTQIENRLQINGFAPSKNRARVIVNDFIALLNRHYAAHHDVAFYAGKLHITPNYLNIILKKNIGISAKEQINIQIVLVIKTLLDTTDMSVKQIAGRLHYDDPSYMCRIFRKHTGMSPVSYRNKLRPVR